MAKTVVHMIGQAHLDPVWLWRWTEGRAEALATSQSAVDRLNEYPDFQFVRGESQIYEWIEQENPDLFASIQHFICEERWHLVNGMVIQPDMNVPGGESFVRQTLLGKAYMMEKFGVAPRVAYCVDSFGHAGTLPMIFKKCGFDYYVMMRPGPHEKGLPSNVFWWEAPDGSRVLTFRVAGAYTTREDDHEAHIRLAVEQKPPELSQTMCFFGVGNHGGGPTKAQIENVQQLAAQSDEWEIRFSDPATFFAAIQEKALALPTVAEELQFHAIGCYSVVSELKRVYRQAENRLLIAEAMAAMASLWVDRPLPAKRLHTLWHDLCFNQFHDTLGGTALKQAEDDAIGVLRGICMAAEELYVDAGRAVAAQIDTSGDGGTVVIFNPSGEPLDQYIEYEPWTDWQSWRGARWALLDETGAPVSYQLLALEAALSRTENIPGRLLFRAAVPPMGYRIFRYAPDQDSAVAKGKARVEETELQNDLLHVTLDPTAGNIASCVDKTTGIELVGAGGWNVPQVLEDSSDTWTHRLSGYGEASAVFSEPQFTVYEDGPLQASILVERRHGHSIWLQQITLRHGVPEIQIRNWLNWQGRWQLLKLAFDVATDDPTAVHDIPFGWTERPCNGYEFPTQMWMDVSGPTAGGQAIGAALLNDGKYGCDVTGSVLRLTVLRSPPYAYHEPHPIGAKLRYDWIDQGFQEFTVIVRPHVGTWQDAGIVQRARELNRPPVPITMHCHPGERSSADSLLSLSSEGMELTAFKAAEDGDGYVARIADRYGRGSSGAITFESQTFPLSIAPFDVVTLRFTPVDGVWEVRECDMLERPL